MKILGLIPARGGSKGIPGKNIKLLGGKPLLAYTVEAAKASTLLDRVILSSDDAKIIDVAKDLGLEVPFVRPAELAGDATSSLEVIRHALEELRSQGEEYDAVCLLQPTTPFRQEGLIDDVIRKFTEGNFDSLISVREVPAEFNPHWIFEEKEGKLQIATGEQKIITRRQELPKAYHRDGAVYITKTSVLLEQNSLYGGNIGFIDTTGSPYVNIDTREDWEEAERHLSRLLLKSVSLIIKKLQNLI
ncbi:acylneuraminate cytidylyltransferase family protein [Antarcticibacterium flavum]|uniref:Acylneuraminate cytidylyltransferase family protein n=1 Tax=Antarcticibacterium flavum TaxID=2058175 RepID=A0A5B7X529_9FLAO|nr:MULTISPECIES: acylneuraminate cytidylyltransferase family protein [Antarcticibacterium]MCM4161913.1 acylneuraminate cytidylyltransferase [Antarcticibacterium sp. W02-3]QCY70546.1 acylneuraminate cytidylyltransferase family protein [Antarcticibacterium flavum]